MAPESLDAVDLELWTQLEEGIEVPRPLRIIKQSGTYTTSNGSIGLRPGALVIPRRGSSRSVSTNTPGAQQKGPFGCLTIHKKRGRGLSSVLPQNDERSSPKTHQIPSQRHDSEQLLEELLSGVLSCSSDWVDGCQEADFRASNAAPSSRFLPPHQFAKLPITLGPQILPYLTADTPLSASSSFLSSPDTIQPSKSTSFFKRSLLRYPKSSNTTLQGQSESNNSAPRGLTSIPQPSLSSQTHFQGQPLSINSAPRDLFDIPQPNPSSKTHLQGQPRTANTALRDLANIPRSKASAHDKPKTHHRLPLKENFRRSSTVASLTKIFRKLSTTVSRSSSSSPLHRPGVDLLDDTATTRQYSGTRHIHPSTSDLVDTEVTINTTTTTHPRPSQAVNMQIIIGNGKSEQTQALERRLEVETAKAQGTVPQPTPTDREVVGLRRQIEELHATINSRYKRAPGALAASVEFKKQSETIANDKFTTQVIKFIVTPLYWVDGAPCHDAHNRQQCGFSGWNDSLPEVTFVLKFDPKVCHAHVGKDRRDMRGRRSEYINVGVVGSSSRYVLKIKNFKYGDRLEVEFHTTFYPKLGEEGGIGYVDLTTSWVNSSLGGAENFFVSRKGDTVERVSPFSLPVPPPFPRRVAGEGGATAEDWRGEDVFGVGL